MDKSNLALGVALVAVAIAIGGYFYPSLTQALGAASGPAHYQTESFLQGLRGGQRDQFAVDNAGKVTVGTSGTAATHLGFASCNLIGTDSSLAASSTAAYDCAVTGVTSTDSIIAMLASSTPRGGSSSWEITGAKASTTAGFVTVLLTNNGPAATPSVTAVGSSTAIWAYR